MRKSIFSLLISAELVLCTTPSSFAKTENDFSEDISSSSAVIVTLDSPSLIDYALEKGMTVSELILSDDGEAYAELIGRQQAELKSRILGTVNGADDEGSRSFNALTNAFTLNVPLSAVDDIASLDGVRSVTAASSVNAQSASEDDDIGTENTTAGETALPNGNDDTADTAPDADPPAASDITDTEDNTGTEPKEYDTIGMASKEGTGIAAAYDEGYTGKGMLIAVIDSDFDVHHDVFSVQPKGAKYNRKYLGSIYKSAGLGVSPKYTYKDLFYNGKIIYAYDYGENDTDCKANDSISHGTHVSGIAAGNNGSKGLYDFKGMAYDAQLAFFKVTDKSGTFREEAIISALDDAVKLGPDVINCSYGAVQYLTRDVDGRYLYSKAVRSGIALISAAGNDSYNGSDLGTEKVPASYTTYGTLCTPSTSEGAFSVASSVPQGTYYHKNYFVFNGNSGKVDADLIYSDLEFEDIYTDSASAGAGDILNDDDTSDDDLVDTVKYIYISGTGTLADLAAQDTAGKLVIIDESSVSVEKLVRNAIKSGCYAIALIRSENDSRLSAEKEPSDFFVYAIDHFHKAYLKRHPQGRVSISSENELSVRRETLADTVSDYSSYGTMADLTLKPDITAPGTDIFSALSDQQFGLMSGTSMASPCMAGAYVILKQYYRDKGLLDSLSPSAAEEFIYKNVMSSAELLSFGGSDGAYYSPRLQGAGLVDIAGAMQSEAYLSVGGKRPAVSLREIADGTFSFEFTLTNISDRKLTFTPFCILQTDGYKVNDDKTSGIKYLNSFEPLNITDKAQIKFEVGGRQTERITVSSGKTVRVRVSGAIDGGFIKEYRKIFTNGFFADGFVILKGEDTHDLHLPFSGFCGDWSSQRLFPDDIYIEDAGRYPYRNSILTIASSFNPDSSFYESAGVNIFGYDDLPCNIAFGWKSLRSYLDIPDDVYTTSSVLLPSLYILRDALDYTIRFYDREGTLLFCQNFGDISSYMSLVTPSHTYFTELAKRDVLHNYYEFADTLEEGVYTYMLSAATVGTDGNPQRTEALSFKVAVDDTMPVIEEHYLERNADGRIYLHVYATDNNYLQGIKLYAVQFDENGEVVSKKDIYNDLLSCSGGKDALVSYEYDRSTRLYHFRYDLTGYKKFISAKKKGGTEIFKDDNIEIIFEDEEDFSLVDPTHIMIQAVDYAYNTSNPKVVDVDSYGEAKLKLVDVSGAPIKNVTLLQDGVPYESDSDGIVKMRDLHIGMNRMRIMFDYVKTDGDPYISFLITKKAGRYEGVFELMEIPEESSDDESSEEIKTIHSYDTSDSRSLSVYAILTAAAFSAALIFTLTSKKHRSLLSRWKPFV